MKSSSKLLGAIGIAAAALGFSNAQVDASSVSTGLSTGNLWQVSGPGLTGTVPALDTDVNPGWHPALGNSKWIGLSVDAGLGNPAPGTYVYTLDLGPMKAGTYVLDANALSDNEITGIKLGGVAFNVPTGTYTGPTGEYTTDDYGFVDPITITGAANTGIPKDIILEIDVLNQYVPNNPTLGSPTGLDVFGSVGVSGAVPLPKSAGVGFGMLSLIGGFAWLRKRFSYVAKIV